MIIMHLPDNGRSYSIRALKKDSIIGHYESVLHYGLSSLENDGSNYDHTIPRILSNVHGYWSFK